MMKIQSLLNPLSIEHQGCSESLSTSLASNSYSYSPPTSTPRRPKLIKDAAIFVEGKVKGEVRYPPYEAGDDEELAEQHRRFQIYPMGHIAEYCRHIPYNSEKKSFLAKTGRDSFEVFQYTFKVPGDDREYTVMWDYNIGLTTPARVLNTNTGLRDISHSITGGALAAQGYWMPFEAAKAVAATFCYNIRYALTPLFGKDFLDMCTHPKDPTFASFKIDREIVRACTAEANAWRILDEERRTRTTETPVAISSPKLSSEYTSWAPKALRPRATKATDIESGYGTDTDQSDKYLFSPEVSPTSNSWTSINRSRSPRTMSGLKLLCSPTPWLSSIPRSSGDETLGTKRGLSQLDDDYEDDSVTSSSSDEPPVRPKQQCLTSRSREARAAYLMMQLSVADAALKDSHRTKRNRRASN